MAKRQPGTKKHTIKESITGLFDGHKDQEQPSEKTSEKRDMSAYSAKISEHSKFDKFKTKKGDK